jgi:hypothetical protein
MKQIGQTPMMVLEQLVSVATAIPHHITRLMENPVQAVTSMMDMAVLKDTLNQRMPTH